MTRVQRYYLFVETAVSVAVNSTIALGASLLAFRHLPNVSVNGIGLNLIPEGFMIGLMGTIVPMLIARARLHRGSLAGFPGANAKPTRELVFAAVSVALLAAATATATGFLLLPQIGPAQWSVQDAVIGAVMAGAILAILVTPASVWWSLRPAVRKARADMGQRAIDAAAKGWR